MSFKVGNGRKVRFWLDKWYGNEPLRVSFPTLFDISISRDAL